tara:strand:- start:8961 stop:9410 length:450 start_codon:yes stop_codon:yes gene_type:complete
MVYYFAYGSLMDVLFVRDLGVHFKNPCSGQLNGFELNVNVKDSTNPNLGYANIVPDKKQKVEGVLFEITEEDLILLDSYEGYPELYSRKQINVFSLKTKTYFKAWVYIGNMNFVVNRNLKLGKFQRDRIKNGFKFLSIEYQRKLTKFIY